MGNKRGQGLTSETLIIILVAVAVGALLIWGFATNWWGVGKKIAPYTGGANLGEVSTLCTLSCGGDAVVYCTSGLKIVNELELSQLNNLKLKLPDYVCEDKAGKVNSGMCVVTKKEGIWKSATKTEELNYKTEELNYYTLQAKVTCYTLEEAGLIDKCTKITCPSTTSGTSA